jgi:YD repeat-containing protein
MIPTLGNESATPGMEHAQRARLASISAGRWQRLRKIVLITFAVCIALVFAPFVGPLTSGALLLLLPSDRPASDRLPDEYRPLHKGYVDLSTGLYVREDEDLIVRGEPPLILRRTYLSRYRVSREFGIGTTHPGEVSLFGDGVRYQWLELILADGKHVKFDRTSTGSSFINAMFEHRATPSEWVGARLGWIGLGWALRRRDGYIALFAPCTPGATKSCPIMQEREPDGHTIQYRRTWSGRLLRMESSSERWIAFDYDDRDRIVRAHDADGQEVRYEYDERGRLSLVKANDGRQHRYAYTDRDEMATIVDPGTTIENTYDANERCVRQANHFPDTAEPYIYEFTYQTEGADIVQAETATSDGTTSRYTFNKSGYMTSETWSRRGQQEAVVVTYERDPASSTVSALTLTCPDQMGKPLKHTSLVTPGDEERIKGNLFRTHCFRDNRNSRSH